MRLDKYLAGCGAGTRSEIKKLIRAGCVRVGGHERTAADMKIDENTAEIYVNGARMIYQKFVYLMLNKPAGYLSATWDKNKPTVAELIPQEYSHYGAFPVGRLDIDTTGLLVLTNDGGLAHRLLSPNRHVPKTYIAEVDGLIDGNTVSAFEGEMNLGDFIAKPARLTVISAADDKSTAEVVIEEGKFHQIKRMFDKVGLNVTYLRRIAMNRLYIDDTLPEGEVRELTDEELELLTYGTV